MEASDNVSDRSGAGTTPRCPERRVRRTRDNDRDWALVLSASSEIAELADTLLPMAPEDGRCTAHHAIVTRLMDLATLLCTVAEDEDDDMRGDAQSRLQGFKS
jgi:hypothetical protein